MAFLNHINIKRNYTIVCSTFGLVAVLTLDLLIKGRHPIEDRKPESELLNIFKTIVIATISFLVFLNFKKFNTIKSEASLINKCSNIVLSAIYLFTSAILLLLIIDPRIFSNLAKEDSIIEYLSAIFLFFASAVFLYIGFKNHKINNIIYKSRFNKLVSLVPWIFSLCFFILGMEEISWFQRILDIPSFGPFVFNKQNETNLHNFGTNPIENIYYFGSFVFFFIIPFIFKGIKSDFLQSFKDYVPGNVSSLCAIPFILMNYDMWEVVFIQIAFYITLFFSLHNFLENKEWVNKSFYLLSIILLIIGQLIILTFGHNFIRLWDATEYKEFFIALAFLIYAFEIAVRVRHS